MNQSRIDLPALMRALQVRDGGPVSCLQTHISWVLLTPTHAYKLRKPVALGFLDFSGAEARLNDCLAELRLNRRTAASLYTGLVAVCGPASAPTLRMVPECDVSTVPPDVLDYAVCMRRFEAGQRLDEMLLAGRLDDRLADELCDAVAAFHLQAERVGSDDAGMAVRAWGAVHDNLAQLQGGGACPTLARYALWSRQQEAALAPLMEQRWREGRVRDVHGDLHLENLCVFDGRVTLFDALEFSSALRCIDVINDLAFLLMDLRARGADRLARRVLNRYLDATGDHAGLPLLRYYMVYRAMVRVKVARLSEGGGQEARAQRYLALADEIMVTADRGLFITHGLSGSGKTTATQKVLEAVEAVRVRSDVERRRLEAAERYGAAATRATYERLAILAEGIVRAGYVAVVDATFLRHEQRAVFADLAARLGVDFHILHCVADRSVLQARIEARQVEGHDASEANLDVLAAQEQTQEPLNDAEWSVVWICDGGRLSPQVWGALHARPGATQPGRSTLEDGWAGS